MLVYHSCIPFERVIESLFFCLFVPFLRGQGSLKPPPSLTKGRLAPSLHEPPKRQAEWPKWLFYLKWGIHMLTPGPPRKHHPLAPLSHRQSCGHFPSDEEQESLRRVCSTQAGLNTAYPEAQNSHVVSLWKNSIVTLQFPTQEPKT